MSGNPNWMTPRHIFEDLHQRWQFTVDAAASDDNHLLPKYWTLREDGLRQDWSGERVFFNPPYSSNVLYKWVYKASECKADVAVGLLPANTDTAWFHDCIYEPEGVEYWFLRGRIKFGDPTGRGRVQPSGGSLIAVWYKR